MSSWILCKAGRNLWQHADLCVHLVSFVELKSDEYEGNVGNSCYLAASPATYTG